MQRKFLAPRTSTWLLALLTTVLAAAACGPSTTLEQSWTTPTTRGQAPLQKVVTVFFSENVTMRRAAEDQLARDLLARGVHATPAYQVLSENELPDQAAVKAKLLTMGYDGVVTMRVVDRHQELEYMPATFDGYWGYAYPGFYSPGFYSPGYAYTETVVRVETSAYSLRTNQLVWSALTKTTGENAEDAHDLIGDTSETVASELLRRDLAG